MADLLMTEDETLREEKMVEDFSAIVDVKLPEAEAKAKEGKLTEALDMLLSLEKQTRTAADMQSTGRVLVCIMELCFAAKDWKLLQEQIVMLSKRRGQLKLAVTKMVQKACEFVDKMPTLELKLELIDTLRDVTAGKIYVEIERARLTMQLAHIREGQGKIAEAAEILQELQVETFGSMERQEKIEFILEQMRLCLAKQDYIRTQIISKKISPRTFDKNQFQPEKLRYYKLMIEMAEHENLFLDICKYYRAIYDTPSVQEDPNQWKEVLKNIVVYVVLAPHNNEQNDLVHRINTDKNLLALPLYKELLQSFVTEEVQKWAQVKEMFGTELSNTDGFKTNTQARWEEFKKRVNEHNLRVIAKCYTRITTARLSVLLELSQDEAEEHVSRLVTSKMIYAKIDRPSGIVNFRAPQDPNEILNEWVGNINKLMGLVEHSTHLINLARNAAAIKS
eukprot:comp22891_c0_seq1/m.36181 comp22891_c0_seq1/g.36181  ORF comp22891_c0_seq1/g.36181 comp22891_c0_seq1/m.36181 type:complete len:450 (-) comp22891_c0_seq1:59-1408(-)